MNRNEKITFYRPGMIRCFGKRGTYSVFSITGNRCALQCNHCRGKLLESMIHVANGEELKAKCLNLAARGEKGVLISGGCDTEGRLPWDQFIPAIAEIRKRTGLFISVHSGIVDEKSALALKRAGVDQALIDVVGDDETYRRVCHVSFGISRIMDSMEAMQSAGLDMVPHIVCGLRDGQIVSEKKAVTMISRFSVKQLVIVSLMKLGGEKGWNGKVPDARDIADVIAEARCLMPETDISLGCARERGNREMEIYAINAGVNRMALPSDEAVAHAKRCGLEVRFQDTCCSVPGMTGFLVDETKEGLVWRNTKAPTM